MSAVLGPALILGLSGLAAGAAVSVISERLPEAGDGRRKPSLRLGMLLAAGAGVGVWAGLHASGWLLAVATALLGWQLLLIALVDGEHYWLPDRLTWPLIATGLAFGAVEGPHALAFRLIGAVFGFGALWLLAWVYRRVRGRDGLGGGDPFLFAGAGAWVGWIGLPSVLVWASAAGLSLVAARLLLRRDVSSGDRLAFGVFLAVGTWLVWLYGPLGAASSLIAR